jgi:ComF family protein
MLIKSLLGLLYPPHCYICERPTDLTFICEGCFEEIETERISPPICKICGCPLPDPDIDLCIECANHKQYFDWARSFGFYEGVLAELVKALKYRKEKALSKELAHLLHKALDDIEIEAITFVPLSPKRKRERGFNQGELLAWELGKLVGLDVLPTLAKTRETKPQTELSGKERVENVKDSFKVAQSPKCANILLVDDVLTTGATASECSRVLKEDGCGCVYVLTVARTRPKELRDENSQHSTGALSS